MGNEIVKFRGGKREGAGRKDGDKTEKVLMREQVMAEMHQRVFKMSHKILNSQMIIALGTHKMIQILPGPAGTKMTRTIRSMDEMQKLLDDGIYGVDYVVIEGRPGDWKAGESILNRTFGKAKETFDINQTTEIINPETKKTADEIVWDYLQGKTKVNVPEEAKVKTKVDELKFNNG